MFQARHKTFAAPVPLLVEQPPRWGAKHDEVPLPGDWGLYTRPVRWSQVARYVAEQPRLWTRAPGWHSQTIANAIRRGMYKDFRPAGYFQAVTRQRRADGKCRLWVRYIGAPVKIDRRRPSLAPASPFCAPVSEVPVPPVWPPDFF